MAFDMGSLLVSAEGVYQFQGRKMLALSKGFRSKSKNQPPVQYSTHTRSQRSWKVLERITLERIAGEERQRGINGLQ